MNYKVFGDNLPGVTISLEQGESIYTQSGCMAWMGPAIKMETNVKGGLLKGLGRMLSGESMFQATFTAQAPDQEITLASSMPGTITVLDIDADHSYIGQKGAFLAATPEVAFDVNWSKAKTGFFGGEGFVMERFSGQGQLFVELDGSIQQLDLLPGQKVVVSTSHIALFEEQVGYDVQTIKGFTNVMFGGEGLFVSTLTGPGRVWLQTMTAAGLANRLIPYMPRPSSHDD